MLCSFNFIVVHIDLKQQEIYEKLKNRGCYISDTDIKTMLLLVMITIMMITLLLVLLLLLLATNESNIVIIIIITM